VPPLPPREPTLDDAAARGARVAHATMHRPARRHEAGQEKRASTVPKRSRRRAAAMLGLLAMVVVVAVAVVVVVVVALSGGSGGGAGAGAGTRTRVRAGISEPLSYWTVKAGEEPGFRPAGTTRIITSAAQFENRLPGGEAALDVSALKRDGFRRGLREALTPTSGAARLGLGGLSAVIEVGSHAAALRLSVPGPIPASALPRGAAVKRFVVAGVPSTNGILETLPAGHGSVSTADVGFAEGLCMLLVNGTSSSAAAAVNAVSHAVLAVYTRTRGDCP
jgi:hypothetical protein